MLTNEIINVLFAFCSLKSPALSLSLSLSHKTHVGSVVGPTKGHANEEGGGGSKDQDRKHVCKISTPLDHNRLIHGPQVY